MNDLQYWYIQIREDRSTHFGICCLNFMNCFIIFIGVGILAGQRIVYFGKSFRKNNQIFLDVCFLFFFNLQYFFDFISFFPQLLNAYIINTCNNDNYDMSLVYTSVASARTSSRLKSRHYIHHISAFSLFTCLKSSQHKFAKH